VSIWDSGKLVQMADISSLRNKGMTTRESGQVCRLQRRDQNLDFNRTSFFEKILCADVTLRPPVGGRNCEGNMTLSRKRKRENGKCVSGCWREINGESSVAFSIFCAPEMKATDSYFVYRKDEDRHCHSLEGISHFFWQLFRVTAIQVTPVQY